jgi:hypothetical protein
VVTLRAFPPYLRINVSRITAPNDVGHLQGALEAACISSQALAQFSRSLYAIEASQAQIRRE